MVVGVKEKLYIFDKYDNLLAITDNYIKADFEETVEMPVSFLINYPASDSDAEYLVGGNQVAFRDLKGDFRLFTIREVDDRDGEATEKIVNCMPGIQELADVMVEERRPQDKDAAYVLGLILENARWQVGNVADLGINSTSFYFKNAYECLGELTDIWGGEVVDRVEIKGNKIAGRYVDIVHRKGSDTGKRFEIDKDIKNITRTVLYYPKTALYGKGKSLQTENEGYTRKITFRDVVWSKKKGDPVDKPKGQEWVGDPDALESHGIPNHQTGKMMHRFGLFEDSEEEDPEKLLAKTWQAVQDEKEPKAQYEMDIITFYGISGYEHEQVFLGDTGIARDKDIKPMILIEARIMSWKYDIGNPEDGSLVLGNILDLDPDDSDIDWVIDKVKDKEGNWDAGGGPITDDKFPDVKPDVPKNVRAEGLFKKIMLSWTFESTYAIAAYEVFASKTNGFAPDPTNLVFRGKVGGYNFDADTDEKWYFRVRAVNTHGTASEYSEQVSASTVQLDLPDIEDIVPDFIEYSIYKGKEAPSPKDYKYWLDTSKEPNILRHWNGEDWKPLAPTSADELGAVAMEDYQEKVSQIVSDLADKVGAEWVNGQLVKKADKEIVDEVKADLAEKVNAEWVNGQLVSKVNKDDVYTIEQVDTRFNNVVSKTTYETDKDGIVENLQSHETMIKQNEKEIESKASSTEYNSLKNRVDTAETSITQNAKEIKSKAELETVNVITGRVESAESSITQNAKEIASKVSGEQYKKDKDGIIRDLESHESRIIQTEKDITAKVDNKQYKQDKQSLETSINKNSAAIQINAEGIASKVDNTTYNTDKQGIITDINSNKSTIEQQADMIRSKVDATYVKGELGKIEVGGRNLIINSNQSYKTVKAGIWYYHIQTRDLEEMGLKPGDEITLSFTAKLPKDAPAYINPRFTWFYPDGRFHESNRGEKKIYPGEEKRLTHTAIIPEDCYKLNFAVQRSDAGSDASELLFEIKHEMAEKGNKATDWTPAPEDTDKKIESVEHYASEIEQTAKGVEQEFSAIKTDYEKFKSTANSTFKQQADLIEGKVTETTYNKDMDNMTMRVSTAESTIKQHADRIESKVSKNGVVSSINQSPEQIKINAQRVSIDGDLVVRNGKVYIKDGVITNDLIASNAKIDFAKIANVRVTNAMISSVTADKIKSGIIDANKVLIRVKNGTQAIQIDDKGFESVDSRGRVRIHIGVRDIAGKGQSDPSTIRFFSGNGSDAASVGMNVNNDFIIGSQNNDVSTSLYSGKRMLYKADAHRFWFNQGPSSNYWEFNDYKDGDGDWHPRIYSNRSAGGYVGIKSRRLWRVYTNYLHCKDTIKLSTRDMKENINDFAPEMAQNIFDQIKIKSYHYKNDDKQSSRCRKSYGPIAEESPKEILDEQGDALVQDNYINVIAGALKYQQQRIDELEKIIKGES
ncbi:phage tail spike protein [Virgibacillus dokdonensis]|uniref:phage tail spike protein n=1 Tax=Virgibacillus dokdonensis TaxID=302167 RepID=UPI00158FE944|nr:phage tail spike protein [Virgibacillus dokdonensis]